jgi:hypothetical protein
MDRALHDIAVLLDYLNELPDLSLLSYFRPTQVRVLEGLTHNPVPPCDSYAEFMERLDGIAAAFQTGRPPPDPYGSQGLGPVAFLHWSRAFLAALAAPATASSIRLTRQYAIYRSRWRLSRLWRPLVQTPGRVGRPSTDAKPLPSLPPDQEDPLYERFALKLAKWMRVFEFATWLVVIFTVLISIYAMSGRLILTNQKQVRDAWKKLDAAVEAEEIKTFPSPQLPITTDAADAANFHVIPLCELKSVVQVQVAAAPTSRVEAPVLYLTARQVHLCDERELVLQNLFVLTMHVHFWSSVIAGPSGGLTILSSFFGLSQAALERFASDQNGQVCNVIARSYAPMNPAECRSLLWNYIDRAGYVAESILVSITQYVMPLCYGLLGAMAAALRLVRRKVDAATLASTDRAHLQQGAILGVLCGAVIGLFANQIGGAAETGGLGISALAFVAGYNVDGVFRFLDELSDRVFGSAIKARQSPGVKTV